MNAKCLMCGKEETLEYVVGKDGRFYVDIQGKVYLRVKSFTALCVLCKDCAKEKLSQ